LIAVECGDAGALRGDLPEQEQEVVWATHFAPAADLFNQTLPAPHR